MKNIMLAVTGLSPQVITETMYALHQDNRKVDAIHAITTRDGKERIYADLLAGETGYYFRYLEEYGIETSSIDFGHRNIHVITDEHGNEIPDILRESDNEYLIKKCLELTFRFTSDPENSVFFSVAGGRKTMSSCLTLAAQMYGRKQDRLYHVLVSPEFESSRDFYYPPKKSRPIELKDKDGHPFFKETRYAEVSLIHMPFFSVREQLAPDLLKEPRDPATLMLALIKEDSYRLVVNLISRKIVYKTIELDLMPSHMALYTFFALQKKNCSKEAETCSDCTECFLDTQSIFERQGEITDIYRKVSGARPLNEMSDTGIINLTTENFNMYKGKMKKELLNRFGPYALKDLEIASAGSRPNTRYGIMMDRSKIEIVY
ncbi:MAG: TIGR02584 family CRISPR-associated protein [Deltaproteobacteria bacterium]|nr:TIGR02584 family CRISPR-associated protein [Deltaproteobacteria bacterium]